MAGRFCKKCGVNVSPWHEHFPPCYSDLALTKLSGKALAKALKTREDPPPVRGHQKTLPKRYGRP